MTDIDQRALDSLSVAPAKDDSAKDDSVKDNSGRQGDAGTDKSIDERLEKNPESQEARLDNALDESMDASDPPSSTQPVHRTGPAPSSGYDEDAEAARKG